MGNYSKNVGIDVYGHCPKGCNQWKCMTWLIIYGHYSLKKLGSSLQKEIVVYNDQLQ